MTPRIAAIFRTIEAVTPYQPSMLIVSEAYVSTERFISRNLISFQCSPRSLEWNKIPISFTDLPSSILRSPASHPSSPTKQTDAGRVSLSTGIKRRYREFKQGISAQRKVEGKSRIKQITLELNAAGTYPAPREIYEICSGKIGMTTAELTLVLREVRLALGLNGHRLKILKI